MELNEQFLKFTQTGEFTATKKIVKILKNHIGNQVLGEIIKTSHMICHDWSRCHSEANLLKEHF